LKISTKKLTIVFISLSWDVNVETYF